MACPLKGGVFLAVLALENQKGTIRFLESRNF